MRTVAIIAAGGRGTRLGGDVPKQFQRLAGRTLVDCCLETFEASPRIDEVVVVLPPEYAAVPLEPGTRRKPVRVVAGGPRRQDSVALGFDHVPPATDVVVIHDAARPFCSAALLARTIDAASESGAAIAALSARDTVKEGRLEGGVTLVGRTLPRETIHLAQTPQAFRYDVLAAAIAIGRGGVQATDEAMLAEHAGYPVRLVDGDPHNVKITTPADLAWARGLVGDARSGGARAGLGYDLHRLVEGRPLILAGVEVPSDRGLLGHSDADAVCHAVTDAMLGAAAAGDIGLHFPDSDTRWKGASSIDLLQRAVAIVGERGFRIENVDVVVVAERPRLAPHLDRMQASLAAALGIDPSRVSIKGKTNEGLDAVGRGEAIAVHAIAMLTQM